MELIRAVIKEKFIFSDKDISRQGIKEIEHEARFFSSREKYDEWYQTFKDKLWEDKPGTKDLREGVYVETTHIHVDDTSEPERIQKYATFRKGISHYYAKE